MIKLSSDYPQYGWQKIKGMEQKNILVLFTSLEYLNIIEEAFKKSKSVIMVVLYLLPTPKF